MDNFSFYGFEGQEFDSTIALWGTACTYRQAVHNPKAYSVGGYTSRPDSDSPSVSASDEFLYLFPAVQTYVFRCGVGRQRSRWNDFGSWPQSGMRIVVPGRVMDGWDGIVGASGCHGSFGVGTVGCGWLSNPVWDTLSYGDRFSFASNTRQNFKGIRGTLDTLTVNSITSIITVVDEDNVIYYETTDFTISTDRKTIQWIVSPHPRGPVAGKVYVVEYTGITEMWVSTPDPQQLPGPERGGKKDELGRLPKLAQVGEWREKPISNAVAHWQD